VVLLHGPVRTRAAQTVLSIAAVLGLVVVVAPWFAGDAREIHDFFYGQFGLLAYSVATAIVLWRLTQPSSGLFGHVLESAPLRWVGGISYEMYLWHWPTYLVVTRDRTGVGGLPLLALRLCIVVTLAWATARLVDDPIRRGLRLRSPRLARTTVAASAIVIGVGVFAGTIGPSPHSVGTSDRSPTAVRPRPRARRPR
jgi:peptidoglycan/LPS O-acetylase OafA/YrhL